MERKLIRTAACVFAAAMIFMKADTEALAAPGIKAVPGVEAQSLSETQPLTDIELMEGAEEQESDCELIIADVNSWVNIRSAPTTESAILGKLYNHAVGELIRTEGDWYYMTSGTVTGYVKAEYFIAGREAEEMLDEVSIKVARVEADALKLREKPSTNARVLQLLFRGTQISVTQSDKGNGWVKVNVNGTEGYVSAEYVTVFVNFISAESKEEEAARLAKEREERREAERRAAELERQEAEQHNPVQDRQTEADAAETQNPAADEALPIGTAETPDAEAGADAPAEGTLSAGADLGLQVAQYAMQFIGNPYAYGGTSLTNGADCSGFVLAVYAQFGISLPHSAAADRRMGTEVGSLAQARPGDLVCYSGHVGIYIGGGQIVHASTPKSGIKISSATYAPIICIRRIFN